MPAQRAAVQRDSVDKQAEKHQTTQAQAVYESTTRTAPVELIPASDAPKQLDAQFDRRQLSYYSQSALKQYQETGNHDKISPSSLIGIDLYV